MQHWMLKMCLDSRIGFGSASRIAHIALLFDAWEGNISPQIDSCAWHILYRLRTQEFKGTTASIDSTACAHCVGWVFVRIGNKRCINLFYGAIPIFSMRTIQQQQQKCIKRNIYFSIICWGAHALAQGENGVMRKSAMAMSWPVPNAIQQRSKRNHSCLCVWRSITSGLNKDVWDAAPSPHTHTHGRGAKAVRIKMRKRLRVGCLWRCTMRATEITHKTRYFDGIKVNYIIYIKLQINKEEKKINNVRVKEYNLMIVEWFQW